MKGLNLTLTLVVLLAFAPVVAVAGAKAEVVEQIARQFSRALGKEAVDFGGDRATRELAQRLIREGGSETVERLGRIANVADASTIRSLRGVSGTALRHLDDLPEHQLVHGIGTLARPDVARGLSAFGSEAAAKNALRAEMQLPGAGLSLVRQFGDDGVSAARRLNDTQANLLLKPDRVQVVRSLTDTGRRSLLDALASNPSAQTQVIRTTGRTAVGSIAVVSGAVVLWQSAEVTLAPIETTVTHPDGTVQRTTTPLGAQVAATVPNVAVKLSTSLTRIGIAGMIGMTFIGTTVLLLRHRRLVRAKR